jgi:hypothetical protein
MDFISRPVWRAALLCTGHTKNKNPGGWLLSNRRGFAVLNKIFRENLHRGKIPRYAPS